MAKYVIAETVVQYHEVDISDELDVFDILDEVNSKIGKRCDACEALHELLEKYKDKFGFDYSIKKNYCGTMPLEVSLE